MLTLSYCFLNHTTYLITTSITFIYCIKPVWCWNNTHYIYNINFISAAGQDYTGGSYNATFLAGKTTASVSIPITDDTTAELTEDFSAVLTIPPTAASQGITKGAADTATIDITDDDTVEVVFNTTQYSVNEGDGVVTLTLNDDKPASFEYTVEVETQNGTATGNLDYCCKFTIPWYSGRQMCYSLHW